MEYRHSDQILWEQGVDDPCDDVTHWLMSEIWIESQKKSKEESNSASLHTHTK
jgi:hypothetical protein